jgi:hypothetical protein
MPRREARRAQAVTVTMRVRSGAVTVVFTNVGRFGDPRWPRAFPAARCGGGEGEVHRKQTEDGARLQHR